MARRIPRFTEAQSKKRVAALRARGCKVEYVDLPNGDTAVVKKCPKTANPGRPPKAWWDRCMFSVSKTNADDPAAVCGAQWHHKMSAKQKRAAVRHERNPDLIPGGLASGKKPSDFNQRSLARGTKIELEHTTSKKIAREIAMDHLTEDPRYYEKLARMENPLSSIWGKYRRR